MAAEKSGKTARVVAGKSTGGTKGVLHPKMREAMWKPGQSGNPSGRAKKLTEPLEKFLARKNSIGRQYAQLLIEAMVKRAIARSDTLVKEIFDRVEGHVPNDPAQAAQFGNKIIVLDIPRPPRLADVSGNGHKPPGENNEED